MNRSTTRPAPSPTFLGATVVAVVIASAPAASPDLGDLAFEISNPIPTGIDEFGIQFHTMEDGRILAGVYDSSGIGNTVHVFDAAGQLLMSIPNPEPGQVRSFGVGLGSTPGGDILASAIPLFGFLGAAYVFDGTTGALLATIKDPNPADLQSFGLRVGSAPDGDIVVTAPLGNATLGVDFGSIYVFDGTTLAEELRIDGVTGIHFAVLPNGNVAADHVNANGKKRVHVYDGETGAQLEQISNPNKNDFDSFDAFGTALAVTPGGDLVVGDWSSDGAGPRTGSAYLFDGTTAKLLLTMDNPEPPPPPPAPNFSESFGFSVAAMPNGDLLIGNRDNKVAGASIGEAYLYDGTTGCLIEVIPDPDQTVGGFFGFRTGATPAGEVLVSGPLADGSAGAIYVFEGPDPALFCQQDLGFHGPGSATLSLCGGDLSLPASTASLQLACAPPGAQAFLVVGFAQSAPPLGILGGMLVPSPDVVLDVFATDAAGELVLPVTGGGGPPVTFYVQAVVPDGLGFEFSNALEVVRGT